MLESVTLQRGQRYADRDPNRVGGANEAKSRLGLAAHTRQLAEALQSPRDSLSIAHVATQAQAFVQQRLSSGEVVRSMASSPSRASVQAANH
jgi:hypothetical protein